jgi:hypothetical protein
VNVSSDERLRVPADGPPADESPAGHATRSIIVLTADLDQPGGDMHSDLGAIARAQRPLHWRWLNAARNAA